MNKLLDHALDAAQAACFEIMKIYVSGDMDIVHKGDGSPLTAADLRADIVIREILQASGLPILSEETPVSFEQRCKWQDFWLVDPLDGTKDFIARNGEFTVNIALIANGIPIVGVVAAPVLKKTWYASIASGAWLNQDGLITPISALAPWPLEPRMFTSYFHDVPASLEFARLNRVQHFIPAGAATKLARIAGGEAEFYPRFAGTSEWDIAAGDAILREAGGRILTVTGNQQKYNKPSLKNPFFVAWRPPLCWEDIKLPA